jgi:hypothetical protein
MLGRLYGSMTEEVTGQRKPHTEYLRNLNYLPKITGVIRSRNMRWEEYVAYMKERCIQNLSLKT